MSHFPRFCFQNMLHTCILTLKLNTSGNYSFFFWFSSLSCEIFCGSLFNLHHSCSCGMKHVGWLHHKFGAAGGSKETEHHWNKSPQGLLQGVRKEGEMRMGFVPMAELGSSFQGISQERIEKPCLGDSYNLKSLDGKTNSVLPFSK